MKNFKLCFGCCYSEKKTYIFDLHIQAGSNGCMFNIRTLKRSIAENSECVPHTQQFRKRTQYFFFFSNYTTQCFNKFKIFFVKLRNKGPTFSFPNFLSIFIFTASVAHFTNIHLLYGIMKYRIPLCIWFAITDPQFIATCHKKGQFDYKCFFFHSSFELIPHTKKTFLKYIPSMDILLLVGCYEIEVKNTYAYKYVQHKLNT